MYPPGHRLLLFTAFWVAATVHSAPMPVVPLPMPIEIQALNDLFPPMPPHCSRAVVTPSRPSSLYGSTSKSVKHRLNIGVGQTVCFTGNASTTMPETLHTVTLSRLEQYHAITQRYRFAIPEVETHCICDCSAKSAVCRADDYIYGRCGSSTASSACHRTFFADQPTTGCPSGTNEPRLCCELNFRPFENRTYTALKLESPTIFAVLRYSAFSWVDGRWSEDDKRTIRVHLDSSTQHQFLDSSRNFELSVSSMGKSSNQLESGMYFVENLGRGLYGELIQQPVNEITDHNFERLGWYRQDGNGQFFVHNGFVMMDKIHRAKVENCVEQKYQSILDANFYVNRDSTDSTKFHIADSLNHTFKWIKSARVVDSAERHAIVTESEGTNLEIGIAMLSSSSDISFVHNESSVEDFTATILVDRFSNSVLNVTVFNATGILNGYVRTVMDRRSENIDSFTLYVAEPTVASKQLLTRIKPYPPNSVQMVCLRPDDSPAEVCRPVESVQESLVDRDVDNRWTDQTSKCTECNQNTVDGIMRFLNPASWTAGINSLADVVELLTNLGVFLLAVIVFYLVVKCCTPLIKCCVCPTQTCFSSMVCSKK